MRAPPSRRWKRPGCRRRVPWAIIAASPAEDGSKVSWYASSMRATVPSITPSAPSAFASSAITAGRAVDAAEQLLLALDAQRGRDLARGDDLHSGRAEVLREACRRRARVPARSRARHGARAPRCATGGASSAMAENAPTAPPTRTSRRGGVASPPSSRRGLGAPRRRPFINSLPAVRRLSSSASFVSNRVWIGTSNTGRCAVHVSRYCTGSASVLMRIFPQIPAPPCRRGMRAQSAP